jgi:hypothetical protein
MIRTAIIQTGFSPDGTRSSTRLDLVRFLFKILLNDLALHKDSPCFDGCEKFSMANPMPNYF